MTAESDDYTRRLLLSDTLRRPVINRAIRELSLSEGDSVLDAGCGIGSQLPLLAELVGLSGHVTGLDISAELISRAKREMKACAPEGRISLVRGDINDLPFDKHTFNCVVSVDCAGYPFARDPTALLRELKRVVKPGGTVAIMGWTYQQILPGHPLLESRLNARSPLNIPPGAGFGSEAHFLSAPGWFQETGFSEVKGSSYAGDIRYPLNSEKQEAVLSLFEMLWQNALPALSDDDQGLFRHLSEPGSPGFVLDKPGYYGFFIYTCFSGRAYATISEKPVF
jgi:SAM-dependent methyltransferase